jgi:polysaccharide biosynthesis protein PelE
MPFGCSISRKWWNMPTAKQHKGFHFAVAAVVFLVESTMAGAALSGNLSEFVAAGAHLIIAAALIMWVSWSEECRKDLRIPLLLTIATTFMGPLGAAGTLVTLAFMARYRKAATSFEEWYSALFPETRTESQMELWQRIIVGNDSLDKSSVAPFSDILFFGTLAQKQELISLMSRSFKPVFAPILRAALNDSNNSIRVQAASAITVIEDDFLRRSLGLASDARQNPRDPALLLKLARFSDEYANAGILDHDRELDSRNKALEAYREYLRLQPEDQVARTAIGRLLLLDEKYDEALLCSSVAIKEEEPSLELILIYMEALYHLHRFDELRRLSAKYASLCEGGRVSPEAVETLKLWASPA